NVGVRRATKDHLASPREHTTPSRSEALMKQALVTLISFNTTASAVSPGANFLPSRSTAWPYLRKHRRRQRPDRLNARPLSPGTVPTAQAQQPKAAPQSRGSAHHRYDYTYARSNYVFAHGGESDGNGAYASARLRDWSWRQQREAAGHVNC